MHVYTCVHSIPSDVLRTVSDASVLKYQQHSQHGTNTGMARLLELQGPGKTAAVSAAAMAATGSSERRPCTRQIDAERSIRLRVAIQGLALLGSRCWKWNGGRADAASTLGFFRSLAGPAEVASRQGLKSERHPAYSGAPDHPGISTAPARHSLR